MCAIDQRHIEPNPRALRRRERATQATRRLDASGSRADLVARLMTKTLTAANHQKLPKAACLPPAPVLPFVGIERTTGSERGQKHPERRQWGQLRTFLRNNQYRQVRQTRRVSWRPHIGLKVPALVAEALAGEHKRLLAEAVIDLIKRIHQAAVAWPNRREQHLRRFVRSKQIIEDDACLGEAIRPVAAPRCAQTLHRRFDQIERVG